MFMLQTAQYQHLYLYLSENMNSSPNDGLQILKLCPLKPEIKETKMAMPSEP